MHVATTSTVVRTIAERRHRRLCALFTMLPAPDSDSLVTLVVGGAALAVWRVAAARHVAIRIGCGALALVLAFAGGLAAVNVHFGYYRSWSALGTDLSGGPAAVAVPLPPTTSGPAAAAATYVGPGGAHAQLLSVSVAGPRSGITRKAYVWLPPQYGEPAFAHTRFPVLELLHGYPGGPSDWITGLHVDRVLADELVARRIGPVVVVMPTINPSNWPGSQECTDEIGGPRDATYLSVDVPDVISHAFRVVAPGASWGIGGFSTGGYCAAVLALRNPRSFGAVVDLDGYLHPSEGGFLPRRFRGDTAAEAGYDVPDLLARDARGPLPAFQIVSGTGVRADENDATALATLLQARESVSLVLQHGAGHTFYAWADTLPAALDWAWHAIAPLPLQRAVPTRDPAAAGRSDVGVALSPFDRISNVVGRALAAHRKTRP